MLRARKYSLNFVHSLIRLVELRSQVSSRTVQRVFQLHKPITCQSEKIWRLGCVITIVLGERTLK